MKMRLPRTDITIMKVLCWGDRLLWSCVCCTGVFEEVSAVVEVNALAPPPVAFCSKVACICREFEVVADSDNSTVDKSTVVIALDGCGLDNVLGVSVSIAIRVVCTVSTAAWLVRIVVVVMDAWVG